MKYSMTGKHHSAATRAKMSKAAIGRPKSAVARRRMSLAKRGVRWTGAQRAAILPKLRRGANHPGWKTLPGYIALHRWIALNKNKFGNCVLCGSGAYTEWALKIGATYSRDLTKYEELCRSCHRKRDAKANNKKKVWSR